MDYRKKASEARKQAARELSAGIKAHLLTIASDYEALARAIDENARHYNRASSLIGPAARDESERS
jgi:hypothetical protein